MVTGGGQAVIDVPRRRASLRARLQLSLGASAAACLVLVLIVELVLGIPVPGWIYLTLALVFAIALLLPVAPSAQKGRLAAAALVAAGLLLLHVAPWSSRKAFLRDLFSIQPGMTEADAQRIMAGYITGTGVPVLNSASGPSGAIIDSSSGITYPTVREPGGEMVVVGRLVFRHSNDGRYNADWGIVTLDHGIVTDVAFSPD